MTFSSSSPQGSFLSGFLRLRIWHVCRPRHIDYFYYSRLLCWAVRTKMRPSIEHRASSYSLLVGISQHGSCFRARPHEPLSLSLNLTQCTEYLACPHTVPLSLSLPPIFPSPLFHPRAVPNPFPHTFAQAHAQTRRHTGTHSHTLPRYTSSPGTDRTSVVSRPLGWSFPAHLGARCRFRFRSTRCTLHVQSRPTSVSVSHVLCLVPSQARLRHDLNTTTICPLLLTLCSPNIHLHVTSDPHLSTFLPLLASVLGLTANPSVIRSFQVVPSKANCTANCMIITFFAPTKPSLDLSSLQEPRAVCLPQDLCVSSCLVLPYMVSVLDCCHSIPSKRMLFRIG